MRLLLVFLLITSTHFFSAQNLNNSFAILDLTERNQEETDGNLFSIEHALLIAGVPYTINTDLVEATLSSFIICSSDIRDSTFSYSEKLLLKEYVKNGGILFLTQLRDPELYEITGVSDYSYSNSKR